MAVKSLAVKYRPKTWDDVTEQQSIKTILRYQLDNNETKNAYLFCGGAGTGKTTCARIFANEINKNQGSPIEIDAASNNSVDDIREVILQAKTQSLNSEFKVFILDECHMLSNGAWNALLKLLEEPPAKSVFIMCTTDPQKIPKTILSRVQRFDFQRISQAGIFDRLAFIMDAEFRNIPDYMFNGDALDYIAKIADGGMRDALTLLDKCLAYSSQITLPNVIEALGTVDYSVMLKLLASIVQKKPTEVIECIESVHMSGKDLKQFVKNFMGLILDVCKYNITGSTKYCDIPSVWELPTFSTQEQNQYNKVLDLLDVVIKLNSDIKYDASPKATIESVLILECTR